MTLQEVAKRARVSPATVSRVLNNTGRVKGTTRSRVLKAIEAIGYQPEHPRPDPGPRPQPDPGHDRLEPQESFLPRHLPDAGERCARSGLRGGRREHRLRSAAAAQAGGADEGSPPRRAGGDRVGDGADPPEESFRQHDAHRLLRRRGGLSPLHEHQDGLHQGHAQGGRVPPLARPPASRLHRSPHRARAPAHAPAILHRGGRGMRRRRWNT